MQKRQMNQREEEEEEMNHLQNEHLPWNPINFPLRLLLSFLLPNSNSFLLPNSILFSFFSLFFLVSLPYPNYEWLTSLSAAMTIHNYIHKTHDKEGHQ